MNTELEKRNDEDVSEDEKRAECKWCRSNNFVMEPGTPPHKWKWVCGNCGLYRKWGEAYPRP